MPSFFSLRKQTGIYIYARTKQINQPTNQPTNKKERKKERKKESEKHVHTPHTEAHMPAQKSHKKQKVRNNNMITWFFSFGLFMWMLILLYLCILHHPSLSGTAYFVMVEEPLDVVLDLVCKYFTERFCIYVPKGN
jgi:ABC-type nickel/cobalt efflux system permease component RcnA